MDEINFQQENEGPVALSVLTENVYYEGENVQQESIQAPNLTENPYYE